MDFSLGAKFIRAGGEIGTLKDPSLRAARYSGQRKIVQSDSPSSDPPMAGIERLTRGRRVKLRFVSTFLF
jgi:hypothetical protein